MTISSAFAFSQVAGYMGKRLTLGYSNNFFISGIGPSAGSYDVGLNTTHSFNLEYTIKNRTNLCLSYQMFNTGVTTNHTFVESSADLYGNTSTTEYTYDPDPNVPMDLHSKNICVGFKFFVSGAQAPVGKYKKLELVVMLCDLTYADKSFTGLDYNSGYGGYSNAVKKSLGTGSYSYKSFALTYTVGKQRVLFNCLVLDYGVQFGFVPAGAFATLNSESDYSNSALTVSDVFRQEMNKRLLRYQLFNFHLGLGFLAL